MLIVIIIVILRGGRDEYYGKINLGLALGLRVFVNDLEGGHCH